MLVDDIEIYFTTAIEFCSTKTIRGTITKEASKEIELLQEHQIRLITYLKANIGEPKRTKLQQPDNIVLMKQSYEFLEGFYKGVTHGDRN